ncbi:heme-binding protein [Rhizobium mongolense]|uniref:GlcG/HbpS family heme-binding protein n=1 Tax=Rhizobium mongolense TaxID=57676 RepID=UPI0035573502
MSISQKQIQAGLEAGMKKAADIGSPSSIAIVDEGRNLLGFVRMDNALLASIEISQAKAYTSRSLNMKTGDMMALVQPGGPLYGMETTHRSPLVVFAGGVPVTIEGTVVGAVGVAGGMPSDDEAIAEAVAQAIAAF